MLEIVSLADITCSGLSFICSAFELFIWGCCLRQSLLPPLKLLAHWLVFEENSWWLRQFCAQSSSGQGPLITAQKSSLSVNSGPANSKLRGLHLWGDRMWLWLSAGFSLRWQTVAWAGSRAVWLGWPSLLSLLWDGGDAACTKYLEILQEVALAFK